MATDAAARRRASFGRAERIKKDAAGQKADQMKATRTAEEQQRDAARLTKRRRDNEAKKIERQKADAAKKDVARQDEQKKADQKKADQARAADRAKEAQQQTEAQARAAEVSRRAVAFIAAREKAQQADQLAAHRHQTSQLRTGHRAEMQSHRENTAAGHIQHAVKMSSIDAAERRDLQAMDDRRRSLAGRVAGIVGGKGHYERQEKEIKDRHEADRVTKHRDHEALKLRQFEAAQTARLRQGHERKAMFEHHRSETANLRRTQEANRPREIEQRQQSFDRAAKLEQGQSQKQERGQGLAR